MKQRVGRAGFAMSAKVATAIMLIVVPVPSTQHSSSSARVRLPGRPPARARRDPPSIRRGWAGADPAVGGELLLSALTMFPLSAMLTIVLAGPLMLTVLAIVSGSAAGTRPGPRTRPLTVRRSGVADGMSRPMPTVPRGWRNGDRSRPSSRPSTASSASASVSVSATCSPDSGRCSSRPRSVHLGATSVPRLGRGADSASRCWSAPSSSWAR